MPYGEDKYEFFNTLDKVIDYLKEVIKLFLYGER